MNSTHLLSGSFFSELFQHNLISPDGRIIGNEQQFRDYSTFLRKQSKDKVAYLHEERKIVLNDVEELLRLDSRTKEEEKLLKELLNQLELEFDEEGLLNLKEPRKTQERYLGPKEPGKSIFERRIEAEVKSAKILKRDLKKLDDWLEQISHFSPMKEQKEHPKDYKETEKKYRQRTANRMSDMEKARKELIKQHYKDYDEKLKSNLRRKFPKEKYLTRIGLKTKDASDKAEIKNSKINKDGEDLSTKTKKNVRNKIAVKDKGKSENVESDHDESVLQEDTGDQTFVKNDTEDGDLTSKAEKSVNNVTNNDSDKIEVLATEQESIVEDNSKFGDLITKTEINVDNEINAIDDAEVKDAMTEAIDAVIKASDTVTDMSSKMHEIKKLMFLSEDTILKNNTSDMDGLTEEPKSSDKLNPIFKIRNVAKINNEVSAIELREAVTKATDAVIETADAVSETSKRMHEVKKRMLDINEKLNKKNKEDEETSWKSGADSKAKKADSNGEAQKEAVMNPRYADRNGSENYVLGSVVNEDVVSQIQWDAEKEKKGFDENEKQ